MYMFEDTGYTGPSSGMEPQMFQEIGEKINEKNMVSDKITIDGDCTLPILIQQNNEKYESNTQTKLDSAHFFKNLPKNLLNKIKENDLTKQEKYCITEKWARGLSKRISELKYRIPDLNPELFEEHLDILSDHYSPSGLKPTYF